MRRMSSSVVFGFGASILHLHHSGTSCCSHRVTRLSCACRSVLSGHDLIMLAVSPVRPGTVLVRACLTALMNSCSVGVDVVSVAICCLIVCPDGDGASSLLAGFDIPFHMMSSMF